MPGFEPQSFIIVSAVLGTLCSFIFFVLRRSFPKQISGIGHWAWACAVMVAGALLFASASALSRFWGSYVPNLLVVSGIILMHHSVTCFGSNVVPRRFYGALLGLTAIALGWSTFIDNDYRMRVIVVSLVISGLFAWCASMIARIPEQHFAERFTRIIFMASAGIAALRCIYAIAGSGALQATTDVSLLQHVYLASFAFSIVALSLGFLLMINRRLQTQLEHAASHDNLTQTLRRDAFFDALASEINHAARRRTTLSLLMIDLDEFKRINDRHGHLEGDMVLADFASKARQMLRQNDLIGRYGGEEFLVLLPQTDLQGALSVAERIRLFAQRSLSPAIPAYTVSIGVASASGDAANVKPLIRAADSALYAAKHAGRNRVTASG